MRLASSRLTLLIRNQPLAREGFRLKQGSGNSARLYGKKPSSRMTNQNRIEACKWRTSACDRPRQIGKETTKPTKQPASRNLAPTSQELHNHAEMRRLGDSVRTSCLRPSPRQDPARLLNEEHHQHWLMLLLARNEIALGFTDPSASTLEPCWWRCCQPRQKLSPGRHGFNAASGQLGKA